MVRRRHSDRPMPISIATSPMRSPHQYVQTRTRSGSNRWRLLVPAKLTTATYNCATFIRHETIAANLAIKGEDDKSMKVSDLKRCGNV
jgi:hypothetical protein